MPLPENMPVKRMSRGGRSVVSIQRDKKFEGEEDTMDKLSLQDTNSVGFVRREKYRWSSQSWNKYLVIAIRKKKHP